MSHVTKRDLRVQGSQTLTALTARRGTSCKALEAERVKIHDLQATLVEILNSYASHVITLVIRDFRREKKDVRYVR